MAPAAPAARGAGHRAPAVCTWGEPADGSGVGGNSAPFCAQEGKDPARRDVYGPAERSAPVPRRALPLPLFDIRSRAGGTRAAAATAPAQLSRRMCCQGPAARAARRSRLAAGAGSRDPARPVLAAALHRASLIAAPSPPLCAGTWGVAARSGHPWVQATCVMCETVAVCPLRCKKVVRVPVLHGMLLQRKGWGLQPKEGGLGGFSALSSALGQDHDPAFCCAPGEGQRFQHSITKAGLCSSHQPGASLAWEGSEKAKSPRTSRSERDQAIDWEKSLPDSLPWEWGHLWACLGPSFLHQPRLGVQPAPFRLPGDVWAASCPLSVPNPTCAG